MVAEVGEAAVVAAMVGVVMATGVAGEHGHQMLHTNYNDGYCAYTLMLKKKMLILNNIRILFLF